MRQYSRDVTFREEEENEEQRRRVIQQFIRKWAVRRDLKNKSGEHMANADLTAYIEEARKYFTLQDKLNVTTDNGERNIIRYKIKTIESKFADLMTYSKKKQLKQ